MSGGKGRPRHLPPLPVRDGAGRPPARDDVPRRPPYPDQLEGRNPVLAALAASRRVKEVWLDEGARPDPKIDELHRRCRERRVLVRRVGRQVLDDLSENAVHNGVIGFAEPLPQDSLATVLDRIDDEGREPLLLLLDQVQYGAAAAGKASSLDPGSRDTTANDDLGNWCPAAGAYGDGDLGTPGTDNPVCQ